MAKNIKTIAAKLGATIGEPVSEAGGGAVGMARLAAELAARLEPGQGQRPGRPTDPSWTYHRKIPMSETTLTRLEEIAKSVSVKGRSVSPMQVAAQLLEEKLEQVG